MYKTEFSFDDYKDADYVMLCRTPEQTRDFVQCMDDAGRKWCTGNKYHVGAEVNKCKEYISGVGYSFNEGHFSDVEYYESENRSYGRFKLLEAQSFGFGEEDIPRWDMDGLEEYFGF